MIFYTADHHFGHKHIIRFCARPFASLKEMDETLVRNWNSTVAPGDIVYIVGDLFFNNMEISIDECLKSLTGKKYLVLGNHDHRWLNAGWRDYFEDVSVSYEITDNGSDVFLRHNPCLQDGRITSPDSGYMVHGHLHNHVDTDIFLALRDMPNMLNAGVEINHYKPVTLDELIKNNKHFKETAEAVRRSNSQNVALHIFQTRLK